MEAEMISFFTNPSDVSKKYNFNIKNEKGESVDAGTLYEKSIVTLLKLQKSFARKKAKQQLSINDYSDFANYLEKFIKFNKEVIDDILFNNDLNEDEKIELLHFFELYRVQTTDLRIDELNNAIIQTNKAINTYILERLKNNDIEAKPGSEIDYFYKNAIMDNKNKVEFSIEYEKTKKLGMEILQAVQSELDKTQDKCERCNDKDCERDNDNNPRYIPCSNLDIKYNLPYVVIPKIKSALELLDKKITGKKIENSDYSFLQNALYGMKFNGVEKPLYNHKEMNNFATQFSRFMQLDNVEYNKSEDYMEIIKLIKNFDKFLNKQIEKQLQM